jgi:hypothetical protein
MVDIVSLVKGDTVANLKVSLVREDNGTVFGMTEATVVKLYIRKKGSTTVIATIQKSAPLSTEDQGVLIFKLGEPGVFLDGNSNVTSGYYEGEVEITFTDNTTQTIFETVPFRVRDQFA